MVAPLIYGGADLPFLLTTPYWKTQDWDVSDYELPGNFVDKLPTALSIFLYYCRDDKICPLRTWRAMPHSCPQATVRAFRDGGHQFDDDLSVVARDILQL